MEDHADSTATWALRYIVDRSWRPIPVPMGTKKPVLEDWPRLVLSVEDVPDYFPNGHTNVGNVLVDDVADVDLDFPEARVLADNFLPTTACVFGRMSNPSSQRLYVPLAGDFKYKIWSDPLLEKSVDKAERDR